MKKFLFTLSFTFMFLCLSLCGSGILLSKQKAQAFTTSNASSNAVTVGELWDSSAKKFNESNLTKLMQFISGNTTITTTNLDPLKTLAKASTKKTAKDFKAVSVTSTIGSSVKASNKDIIVSLGGLNWTPVYLSTDTNSHPILTLWLADAWQLSGKRFYRPETPSANPVAYKFGNYGTTIWNAGYTISSGYDSSPSANYPDAMYGVSCMRSVILNNGGMYITAINGSGTNTFTKKTDSVFSPFTVTTTNKSAIADYLVSPKYVAWQMNLQTYKNAYKNYLPNDSWQRYQPDSRYADDYNWSKKDKYDAWKNDLLWLPSASETGFDDTDNIGMWKTSLEQRTIGNTGGSWLRSATSSFANGLYRVNYTGKYSNSGFCSGTDAVRPAIHLNLAAASGEEDKEVVKVNELWNSVDNQFNDDNVAKLLQYVTGDSTASPRNLSTVKTQATSTKTSTQINAVALGDKKAGQDVIVSLGGLYWLPVYLSNDASGNPILTLWLWKSNTLCDQKVYTSNTTYSYFDGVASSTWNSGFTSNDNSKTGIYPDNMYGTSYIRSVTLNNGGLYSTATGGTSASTFTKKETSVFSPFTITTSDNTSIADFLVTPANVSWQKSGQNQVQSSLNYLCSNDSWITNQEDTGFSSADYNYSKKDRYDAWKNDRIWLPSISEVGFGNISRGLWYPTLDQRNNGEYTYLRSAKGDNANQSLMISINQGNYSYVSTSGRYAVRPAIHLSLTNLSSGTAIDMDSCAVDDIASQPWNPAGNIIPDLTVRDSANNKVLVKGTDYTVTSNLTSATKPGDLVTVTISGIGDYAGTTTKTYQLTKRDIVLALKGNSLSVANQQYTGQEITPAFNNLKDYGYLSQSATTPQLPSGRALILGQNYSLTYQDNINCGTATIVITGIGDYYEGSTTTSFTISQASIGNAILSLTRNSVMYEYGEDFLPSVRSGIKLTLNGTTIADTNYTINFLKKDGESAIDRITEVGVYIVRIVAKGNFVGTKDAEFEVTRRDVSGSDIKVEISSYNFTYNGNPHEVTVKVTGTYTRDGISKKHELVLNTEYTISYEANINASTSARVIITGVGNFTGLKTTNFTIKQKLINGADIVLNEAIADVIYNGSPFTPTVSVHDNTLDKDLVLGVDYTVSYRNNINACVGSSQAMVVVTGVGNYTNFKEFYFNITQRDISLASIATITDQIFTGSGIEPNLIVIDSGKTLIKNRDYLVTCKNNVNVSTSGGASVVIDGIGNYTGKNTAVFTIIPADLSTANVLLSPSQTTYTGLGAVTSVSVVINSINVASTNYDVKIFKGATELTNGFADVIEVGVYTIRVEGKQNYEGTAQGIFEVVACEISNTTITLSETSFVYNQEPQTPTVVLTYNGLTLNDGNTNDYSLSYRKTTPNGATVESPTTVGIYYVVLSGKGNFKGIDTTLSFEITPANLSVAKATFSVDPTTADFTFDGEEHRIVLTSLTIADKEYYKDTEITYIGVSYLRDEEETTDFVNAGNITIKLMAINENVTGEKYFTYTIKRKSLSLTDNANQLKINELENKIYNRKPQTQEVFIVDTSVNNYNLTENDFSVSYSADCTNVGKVTVYITGNVTGNYKDSITREYQITPATVNSFELRKESGKYTTRQQVISAIVKVLGETDEETLELTPSEYTLLYARDGGTTTNITSVGEVTVTVSIKSKNFVLSGDVTSLIYTIEKVQIKAINLQTTNVVYDGGAYAIIVSSVTTIEGTILIEDEDYELCYYDSNKNIIEDKDNLYNAGTYYVAVEGKNNAEGTQETTFIIAPKELTAGAVTYYETYSDLEFKKDSEGNRIEIILETNYRGQYVMPVVTVKLRGETDVTELTYSTSETDPNGDFTFGIYDPINDENCENNLLGGNEYLFVGEFNFVVKGINNYTGTISKVYKVNLADFNNQNIKITFNVQKIYSGEAVTFKFAETKGEEAEVKVTYEQGENKPEELVLNTDFVLFNGYIKVTLNAKNEIIDAEISSKAAYDESDNGVNPDGTIILPVNNGYVNNTGFGKATLVLQGKENSYFVTNSIVTKQFDISKVSFNADNLTLTGFEDEYIYQGSNVINPEDINVSISYKTSLTETITADLVYGTDYELTLSNCTDVGTVYATITGMNAYSETARIELFNIIAKEISIDMFTISPNTTYSKGLSQQPIVSGSYNSNAMVENKDYTIIYKRNGNLSSDFVSAGDIILEISGIGNFTNASGPLTVTYTIAHQIIAEIVLNKTETIFSGLDQTPTIVVKDILGNAVDSIEYVLTYLREDNVPETNMFTFAGTIKISIEVTDNSNYTLDGKNLIATYTINKAQLNATNFSVSNQVYTGFGVNIEKGLVLTLNNSEGSYNINVNEYEITEYRNNVNVSTSTNKAIAILIANDVNFTGRKEIEFTIVPKNIADEDVRVGEYEKEFIYTSLSQEPTFNLNYLHNNLLVETDFTVSIVRTSGNSDSLVTHHINVGNFDVTLSGKGNFTGQKTLTYSIKPRDISTCTVDISFVEPSFEFTGTGVEPTIQSILVTFSGKQLRLLASEYTITYDNNVNATVGTNNKASITINANGNYTGSKSKEFTILQKTLTGDMLTSINSKSYIGSAIRLSHSDLIFNYGDYIFKESDYQISYLQNPVNVGTYLITITGKENFKGTIEKYFDVVSISLNDAVISFDSEKFNVNEVTYTGLSLKQTLLDSLIVTIGDVTLNPYDYEVTFNDSSTRYLIDVGTKGFTLIQNNKNIVGEKSHSFIIVQKSFEDTMLEVPKQQFVYTGSGIEPIYYLTFNDIALILGTDYNIIYTENVEACPNTSAASFTVTGTGNFTGSLVYSFSIKQATPTIEIKEEQYFFYGDIATAEEYYREYLNCSTIGTLSFKDKKLTLGKNTIHYTFTPTDIRNYKNVEGNIDVYAIYNVLIEFSDVTNVIAGENTKVEVTVKIKDGEDYLVVNDTNYIVTITNLDNNKIVNNLASAGNYQVKVTLNYPEGDYKLQNDDFVEFYAKSKVIYADNAPFYAVSDNFFEEGIRLVVETYKSRDEIIAMIGNDNYESVKNIAKGYRVVGFYKNNIKLEGEELAKLKGVKIYFSTSSRNDFYMLNNENSLSSVQFNEGRVLVEINSCLVETTRDNTSIIIYISIALGLLLLIVIVILIIKLIGKQKFKKSNKITITMSEFNSIANSSKANNNLPNQNQTQQPQQNFQNIQNGIPPQNNQNNVNGINQQNNNNNSNNFK